MKISLNIEFADFQEAAEVMAHMGTRELAKQPSEKAPDKSSAISVSEAREKWSPRVDAGPELIVPKEAIEAAITGLKEAKAEAKKAEKAASKEVPTPELPESVSNAEVDEPTLENSAEYLKLVKEALPKIGAHILKGIMLEVGHVTSAGTPAGVKDPLPDLSKQKHIMDLVHEKLAEQEAETAHKNETTEEAEDTSESPLTHETYLAKINEARAVVGDPGWVSAVRAVGHVNSENKPLSPKSAPEEKWVPILEHLAKLVKAKQAA